MRNYGIVLAAFFISFEGSLSLSIRSGSLSTPTNEVWTKAWCPLAVIDDVDHSIPHSATILGKDYVFWKSGSQWAVADDCCPHRLAPLNLGYINEKNELTCRYHGWCFQSNGSCTAIPQAENLENAVESKRCKLPSYVTRVQDGILWFWPSADNEESVDAAIPTHPEFSSGGFSVRTPPMDYEAMVENTFDPSHAMFLHDGSVGFKSKEAIPMTNFSLATNITSKGFKLIHGGYKISNKDMDASRTFIAPYTSYVVYKPNSSSTSFHSLLHFVPEKPGYTRVIGSFKIVPNESPDQSEPSTSELTSKPSKKSNFPLSLITKLFEIFPKWMIHSLQITVEEQDLYVLHHQKIQLQQQEASGKTWRQAYYLPTRADVGVVAFRQWLEKYSGNSVPWLDKYSSEEGRKSFATPLDERALLDRYSRHTKHCIHCQTALKRLTNVVKVLQIVTAASALRTLFLSIVRLPLKQPLLFQAAKPIFKSSLATAVLYLLLSWTRSTRDYLVIGTNPFKTKK